MPISLTLPNIMSLDGTALTEESRQPFSVALENREVVVELANGAKRKYLKGTFRKFNINWENVAKNAATTVDGFGGRDEIRAKAFTGGSLELVVTDGIDTDTYTVFVDSYSEELLQRRAYADGYRYNISLELSQVE